MLEEEFLEGRRSGGEGAHPVRREPGEEVADLRAVDEAGEPVPVDGDIVGAGEGRQIRWWRSQFGRDMGAGQMSQLGERARLDDASGADDAHVIAELLDLGEDVARQECADALIAPLADDVGEDALHEWVQARRGLVEQEQFDVGGEGGHEGDLLPVALGIGAALLRRVEVEAFDQIGALGLVQSAAGPAEQVDDLAAGEIGPEGDVARAVRETAVQRRRVGPRVAPEQAGGPAVRAEQTEQDPDRRGLARTIGSEEAMHLTGFDLQVEAVQRPGRPEGLDEAGDIDDMCHPSIVPLVSGICECC